MAELLAEKLIRAVPDFPLPGILFRDITPVLQDARALHEVVEHMAAKARERRPDVILGIESRGFLFGLPIALQLGLGFAIVRKPGKLPYEKIQEEYSLEYGTNTLEIHEDAVKPGQRVVVVDDLLATGGTAAATRRLVERLGGEVVGFNFLVELEFLNGREVLGSDAVDVLIRYA